MSTQNPVIALAGNPNVGKTTLFNAITGAHQTVGNWPGVTVERKEGYFIREGKRYEVVDLPGIYSLAAASPDEKVARDFLTHSKPDLVINIVDASNLERNLYLTLQLMELKVPLLIVFSMLDIAAQNGIEIDFDHLKSHLECPVRPLVLTKRFDAGQLFHDIESALDREPCGATVRYDEIVEKHLENISALLDEYKKEKAWPEAWNEIPQKWTVLKLMERDPLFHKELPFEWSEAVEKEIRAVETHRNQSSATALADDRYGYIRGLVKDVAQHKTEAGSTFSDKIDRVVLSGVWGLPVFFVVMYLVFLLSVRASEPIMGWLEDGITWLMVDQFGALLRGWHFPEWISYLLSDALGGGLATIASFIPPIFFIFLSLSILEDSGYLARAAFIADKFMRRVGLPGKAFIPLVVGFGCTVPAIMATRTLESRRDRIFASLLTPFMSCGAKLPVYTYLSILFFPKHADLAIFGLYLFGIVMGMVFALLLRKTLFKTDPGNFVMELPAYHMPTFNAIGLHTWHRLREFILRAGKVILLVIVAVNILQGLSFTLNGQETNVLEIAGKAVTPLLRPMGVPHDNWGASVALISGVFAKEAVVGVLEGFYPDSSAIPGAFGGTASGIAFLIFVLLYSPCAATLAALLKEHGWRWSLFSFFYLTLLAWIVATVVYQIMTFNAGSWLWLGVSAALVLLFIGSLNLMGKKNVVES
ncbi:MAG: ferrous iron transport protein B [Candidatus Cloacimonetes bacterium]|nr:ferrous iron transport protein B [Candidatus Cloacimonadota bacterium]